MLVLKFPTERDLWQFLDAAPAKQLFGSAWKSGNDLLIVSFMEDAFVDAANAEAHRAERVPLAGQRIVGDKVVDVVTCNRCGADTAGQDYLCGEIAGRDWVLCDRCTLVVMEQQR